MGRNRAVSAVIAGMVMAMLGMAAAPALAQKTSGLYVGAGVGGSYFSDLSNLCNNQLPAAGVTVTSCDNKGFAAKGFVGYQFIRYFGVELGYYDFGKGTIKNATGGSADWKARGPYAGIVVSAPMTERLSFLARAGVLRWSTKLNPDGNVGFPGRSDNGLSGSFGAGLEYMFTDSVGVRGEFERYQNVGNDGTTGQTNINVWTVSGLFRF